MTNIAVPIPPSLQIYREALREFFSGMVRKLDRNSHKKTPTTADIITMVGLLRDEIEEFEDQYCRDAADHNALVELYDTSNFAFLIFLALRFNGTLTPRERLINQFLEIDTINGRVYCKQTRAGSQYKIGQEIKGTNRKGYVDIKLQSKSTSSFGITVPRSHLIWWKSTGQWPIGIIDHINRDKSDDRISNLRDSSFSDNNINNGKDRLLPRHVVKYVPSGREHLAHWGKYVYQRHYKGQNIRIAYFDTPEEASIRGEAEWTRRVGEETS